jgi:hypothetical protein
MASTVAGAFDEFEGKLRPTDKQKTMIASRRSVTADYLCESFGSSSGMKLLSTKVIGSASRDSIIRPIGDIDVLAVFEDEAFYQYRNDSRKFLYRVRDALNKYNVKVVGARGQAVRLFYSESQHVDIVPAVGRDSGGYFIPSGETDFWGRHQWLTTDTDEHARWISERNAALGCNLKPLIRLLKRWNREHSSSLRSFHLEVMVASTFSTLSSNRRTASQKFFEWAGEYIRVKDPAGHSGDLSSYMTCLTRPDLRSLLASSSKRATKALAAEESGDLAEAARLWRIIYGPEFPTVD